MAGKQINGYSALTTYTGTYQFLVDDTNGAYKNFTMDKLSPVEGSANIVTVGTVATGTWQGTVIDDSYIASANAWNAKSDFDGVYSSLISIPTTFTPAAHNQVLSTITDAGSIASVDYWTGTQAAYDLLTPDSNTLYVIIG